MPTALRGIPGLVAGFAAGCSAVAPAPAPAPVALPAASPTAKVAWVRHAGKAPNEVAHSIDLGGECLTVTVTGLRATSPRSPQGECPGPWEIAVQRLPPLAAVRRLDEGFAFLSVDGSVWRTPSPLGNTTSHVRPAKALSPVTGAFVALDAAGRPYTFDGTWKPSLLPEGVALFAAEPVPHGLVALGAPESIWISRDQGARFVRAGTEPANERVALTHLVRTSNGTLLAEGRAGDLEMDATGTFRRSPRPDEEARRPDELAALPGPDARVVDGRTAVLSGMRYFELRDDEAPPLHLVRGSLGESFEELPIASLEPCAPTWLAARDTRVAVGCARPGGVGESPVLVLFGSTDGGTTFGEWGQFSMVGPAQIHMTMLRDGALFLTGVCGPPRSGEKSPCSTEHGVLRRAEGSLSSIALGPMDEVLAAVASEQGMLAVLGLAQGEIRLSQGAIGNGETSLQPVPLGLPPSAAATSLCSAAVFDDDGTLGFCAGQDGAASAKQWVVVDGKTAQVSHRFIDAAACAGAGRQVLAASDSLQISHDGGATWETVASGNDGASAVACSSRACIVGDGLVRLGWGKGEPLPAIAMDAMGSEEEPLPRLGPVVTCQLPSDATATDLDRVLTSYLPLPALETLGRREALFELVVEDARSGVVERVYAALDPKTADAPLLRQAIFGARAAPGVQASWRGGAVVRPLRPAPEPFPAPSVLPARVDVAWLDPDSGRIGKTQVVGTWNAADSHPPELVVNVRTLDAWLVLPNLSVAVDGTRRQLKLEEVGPPFFRPPFSPSYSEHVAVDASTYAEVMVSRIWQSPPRWFARDLFVATHAWLDHGQSPPVTRAETIAANTEVAFSRRGPDKGLILQPFSETASETPRAGVFRPLLASGELGPPVAVAAPSDFDAAPRRCSASDRLSTPRAVWKHSAHAFSNGRRPVALTTPAGTEWGLADGIVLHGSPQQPCASAFRASAAPGGWVVVLDGSLTRGWLFRPGPLDPGESSGRRSRVAVSPLVCREDTKVLPPPEVVASARRESTTTLALPPGKK